jgi:hypothetical protein
MDEIGHIEKLEGMVTDLFDLIYRQQELMRQMDCKMAITQKTLNSIEAKLAQLKSKLKK